MARRLLLASAAALLRPAAAGDYSDFNPVVEGYDLPCGSNASLLFSYSLGACGSGSGGVSTTPAPLPSTAQVLYAC